jgi:hypothetical protein
MVTVWSPIRIAPVRAGPLDATTVNCTSPGPTPFAPDAIVIQSAVLAADQGHPAAVCTDTTPLPPEAGTLRVDGPTT